MRLRSTGAAGACARPARCGDSSGGILLFLHRREIPRRAAGPEEVGPAALRARFRQRRGGGGSPRGGGGGGARGAARAVQATAGRRRMPLLRRGGGRSCVVVRRRRSPVSREGTMGSLPRRRRPLHGGTRLSRGAGSPTFRRTRATLTGHDRHNFARVSPPAPFPLVAAVHERERPPEASRAGRPDAI